MTLVPKRCAGISILVLSLSVSLAAFASADAGKHSGTGGGSQETDAPDPAPVTPPAETQAPAPQDSSNLDALKRQVDQLEAHNAELKSQLASLNKTYDGGSGGSAGVGASTNTVTGSLGSKTPRTAPKIPIAADASSKGADGGGQKGPSAWDGIKGSLGTWVALAGFGLLAFGLCFMDPVTMAVGAGVLVLGLLGGPLLQTFT